MPTPQIQAPVSQPAKRSHRSDLTNVLLFFILLAILGIGYLNFETQQDVEALRKFNAPTTEEIPELIKFYDQAGAATLERQFQMLKK